jgi:hypothetical protein
MGRAPAIDLVAEQREILVPLGKGDNEVGNWVGKSRRYRKIYH